MQMGTITSPATDAVCAERHAEPDSGIAVCTVPHCNAPVLYPSPLLCETMTMGKRNVMIIAVAALLLAVPATLLVRQPATASEQAEATRTISVTGASTTKVTPDMITISFTIETQAATAQQGARANADIAVQVVDALQAAGVSEEEISTTQYSIFPVYKYGEIQEPCYTEEGRTYCPPPHGAQVLVGYRAVNSITVESTKLDMAGQWIDVAVEAGANRVDSLYFSLSAEKQDEARNTLIPMAVQDAKNKAEVALEPLGVGITSVLTVNLDSYPPIIYPKRGFEFDSGSPTTTPIIPGPQEVTATVHVTFEIGATSESHVTSMTTSAGQNFTVTLDSNPSTGYQWEASSISNSELVRFVSSEFIQSDSGLVGAGGKQTLTFQALKAGKSTIVLDYARPWEKENPTDTYIIQLTIR